MIINFYLCTDYDGGTLTQALVQYTYDDEEHPVTIRPHGNPKRRENFIRTTPITLRKLKNVAQDLTPKFTICEATSSCGGLSTASSIALKSSASVKINIRRQCDETFESPFRKKDPLFVVMSMCKESEGKNTL